MSPAPRKTLRYLSRLAGADSDRSIAEEPSVYDHYACVPNADVPCLSSLENLRGWSIESHTIGAIMSRDSQILKQNLVQEHVVMIAVPKWPVAEPREHQ